LNIQIAQGVDLKIIQTSQFKNNTIVFNFSIPSNYKNFAKLALLADLLENASLKFPSEMLVSRKLSEMFGASYGVTVLRYGNQHTLRIRLTFPNNHYLPHKEDLLNDAMAFLREMIERPFAKNDQFDAHYFKIHQTNLMSYLDSISDNKEFYSTLQLQKLYYANDLNQGTYLLGNIDSIRELNASDLYNFYRAFIQQATVTVIVAGQIDQAQVVSRLKSFSTLSDRNDLGLKLFIEPELPKVPREKTTVFPGSQSLLNIGYRLPIYFGDDSYFAANVFNQIFGASTRSLLFTNVREKASLAYDIHSSYNSFSGMLSVQAGIEFKNLSQVIQTTDDQLTATADMAYPESLLAGVKKSMINQHRSQSDYLSTLAERQYVRQISGVAFGDSQWEQLVNDVTKKDVAEVAKRVQYQARYILQSQGDNDENN
jgi:predicted Zn-dependent peptidase